MERHKEDILLLEEENLRLNAIRERYERDAEDLEKKVLVSKENEKSYHIAIETIEVERKKLELEWEDLESERVEIEEKNRKQDETNLLLEDEERRSEEQREEQKAEAGILEEESQWLARKRADHVNTTIQLDEEEELLSKRRNELDEDYELYEEEVKRLEEKRKKLKEDEESLVEEEKWIASKREEHVVKAQELDEERKWLEKKQKELEALAGVYGENEDEEATPESIDAFELAKRYIELGNIAKFKEVLTNHPEIINFVEEESQNTLLHWASAYKHIEMAKLLLSHDATQFTNDLGLTPYEIAAIAVDEGQDMSYTDMKLLLQKHL